MFRVPPGGTADGGEVHPLGVVAGDLVPAEHLGAQVTDERDGRLVAVPGRERAGRAGGEPGALPHVVVQLEDEGARVTAVGVAVDLHDSPRRVQYVELERVEDQVGAEPDVLAPPGLQAGPEGAGQRGPGLGVGPVGRHHQVVSGGQPRPGPVPAPGSGSARPARAHRSCRMREQPVAAHGGEAVPTGGDDGVPVVHVDVVPAGELPLHGAEDGGVGVLDAAQRLVREHHPEAERVVGGVPLPHGDLVPRVQLLGQRGEVQPAGAAAEHRDAHRARALPPLAGLDGPRVCR